MSKTNKHNLNESWYSETIEKEIAIKSLKYNKKRKKKETSRNTCSWNSQKKKKKWYCGSVFAKVRGCFRIVIWKNPSLFAKYRGCVWGDT